MADYWHAWHASYANSDSALAARLALVQAQIAGALDRAAPGPVRAISICAGQGHDLIGVLAEHPRRADVSARLVELDERNVLLARLAAKAARLDGVEVLAADAAWTDSYIGAVPADVVVVCGVFGNISTQDVFATIANLRQLCAPDATVVWTRHRHPPDLVPDVVSAFERAGFEQLACEDAPPFAVAASRLRAAPLPLRGGVRLFEFIGHRALWPHIPADRRAALDALFRSDCSLAELVEAVRALPFGRPRENTVDGMLSDGRGTSSTKHLFLAQVLRQRFPDTQPEIVHRVHRLDRERARERFGAAIAESVPAEGLIDVHRYITIALDGRRIALDVTLHGPPWDGRSPLEPACGPGQDFLAGADPDADMRALEQRHCERAGRAPFLVAVGAAGAPPR